MQDEVEKLNTTERIFEAARFPKLRSFQIPRLGLISPSLPSAAPFIEELLSFESWEFQSALSWRDESQCDQSVAVSDFSREDHFLEEGLLTDRKKFRTSRRKITKGELRSILWRKLFRRSSRLQHHVSFRAPHQVRYKFNLSIDNHHHRRVLSESVHRGGDTCRKADDVVVSPKQSSLVCRTPSIIRLQQLLSGLPCSSRLSFYCPFHLANPSQLSGLRKLLAPYISASIFTSRCPEGYTEISEPRDRRSEASNFSASSGCARQSLLPFNKKGDQPNITPHACEKQFHLTAGVELDRFFRPA